MSVEQLSIRLANLSDAKNLATLMRQLGYPTTASEMEERLKKILVHADYHTLVAVINDHTVGMIGVHVGHYYEKNGVYGQIVALVIDREYRGLGIGSSLVAAGEQWCRSLGGNVMIVNSGNARLEAHRFYEQLGYQATGVRFAKMLM